MRLASRFGRTNSIRRERPLTNDELIEVVPSIFLKKNTTPVVNVTPISQQSHCWIN